jgi:hypothetical protein
MNFIEQCMHSKTGGNTNSSGLAGRPVSSNAYSKTVSKRLI